MTGLSLAAAADYLVVMPAGSAADPAWHAAGDALAAKHSGTVAIWDRTEAGLVAQLQQSHPRYLAIVGRPGEFDPALVRAINRATRAADDDPWTDCRWGLITGATAADALKLIRTSAPLVVKRALCTTGINLDQVESALVISDGAKGDYTRKLPGQAPTTGKWDAKEAPDGTIGMFAEAWNHDRPQLLVTSSHATQFNLEMPFSLGLITSHAGTFTRLTLAQRNEFAKFLGGAMFTGDNQKLGAWIDGLHAPALAASDEPKVWIAAGNCLIGDARKTSESMVVTALGSGGVKQFVGYVVPTWFGRNGWGTLKMWQESRGRLSLSEAFYLNEQKLIDETITRFPGAENVVFDSDDIETGQHKDRQFITGLSALQQHGIKLDKDVIGLIHDRDVVAFWGDPLWDARLDASLLPPQLSSSWKPSGKAWDLTIQAAADFDGEYPLWLPERLASPQVQVPAGAQVDAVAGANFLLLRKVTLKKGEHLVLTVSPAA